MLERALAQWSGQDDLWIFGYGSLIWRPDFPFQERRAALAHGWHRALKMWSTVNRGTPECRGLVFGLLPGGSCKGMVFRVQGSLGRQTLTELWKREMVTGVYDPRWLPLRTAEGPVRALAFTLSRSSPSHTGELSDAEYQSIFASAAGRFGSTHDYAHATYASLREMGIEDKALARILRLSQRQSPG